MNVTQIRVGLEIRLHFVRSQNPHGRIIIRINFLGRRIRGHVENDLLGLPYSGRKRAHVVITFWKIL